MYVNKLLKKYIKLVTFVLFILSYFFWSLVIWVLSFFSFDRARPYLIKNISIHSILGLILFRVKLDKKWNAIPTGKNFLIVCNHLTYVDIFVISRFFPSCFVTSYEMKETPLLGQICSLGGCLFVERRSKKGLSSEVKNLTDALMSGINVVVFPEATSTNGEKVLRFRTPMFQAAIDAQKEILPLCLNYKKVNGEDLGLHNRDKVFWYGDMTFFPHFLSLLDLDEIHVELSVLEEIKLNSEDSKIELAERSFEKIQSIYRPVVQILE